LPKPWVNSTKSLQSWGTLFNPWEILVKETQIGKVPQEKNPCGTSWKMGKNPPKDARQIGWNPVGDVPLPSF